MTGKLCENKTPGAIALNILLAAFSLFLNGFGVYLTIHADIGAAPWDVLNLGLSGTFSVLYGTASITVSLLVLLVDVLLREPIGIAMFIDAVVVGKSVDLFESVNIIPVPQNLFQSVLMLLAGLIIMGYTQFLYMRASLGCGPRDTLLVALARRARRIPIGVISIIMLGAVTLAGYLLGGKVGLGTLLCAALSGPVMQLAFRTVRFDATAIRHQSIPSSFKIFARALNKKSG